MWAVVLVPMWLRRHDASVESRSVDRFSTAMRTLSRRTHATPGRRYVVMPRREAGALSVHVSGASAPRRPAARPAPRPARSGSRASLVTRRRRALVGLMSIVGLTLVLAVAGVISWPFQIVVDLVLGAFVVPLRAQARRAAVVSRQRRRAATAPARTPRPATVPAREPASQPLPAAVETEVTADVSLAAEVVVEVAGADVTWEP